VDVSGSKEGRSDEQEDKKVFHEGATLEGVRLSATPTNLHSAGWALD
jgi:hypothetical protein